MASKKRAGAKKRKDAPAKKVRIDSRVGLVALLLFLASGALGALYTMPQLTEYRSSVGQLDAARTEVVDLSGRLERAASSGDSELARLYETVQALENAFPSSPSREELTVQIVELSERFGVQVQRLDPAPDPQAEDLSSFRFSARFAGSYDALVNFLAGLDDLGPVVTLREGQVSAQGDLFVVTTTIEVWYVKFLRLTEAPEPSEPAGPSPEELERLTILLTIPAALSEGQEVSQVVADYAADGIEITDARRNPDGSLSYRMLRTDHEVVVADLRTSLLGSLPDLVEQFVPVSAIVANDDFTEFTVSVEREAFEQGEGRAVIFSLFGISEVFTVFSGADTADLTVRFSFADVASEVVFDTAVLPEGTPEG